MLIHGLFGSLDNLAMLRRPLEQNFQILSVDLPDHGKSIFTETFSYQHYAQLLIDVTDDLSISKISLVGHSMGGKVAMKMALEYPDRIDKLVMLDIAPVAYSPRHNKVFEGLSQVKLGTLRDRRQADDILSQTIDEPGVRQFLLKSLYKDEKGWQWRFNLELLQRDYSLLSEQITSSKPSEHPTLFIKAELSDYLKAEYRPAVLTLFPKSVSKVVGGTGHWLHAEKPAICARMITDFLLA
ncbi:MAG: esterase [Paraglaciecola sp.]|jgi:esterase